MMGYTDRNGELDSSIEYEMINTLFNGGEDEARLKSDEEEEAEPKNSKRLCENMSSSSDGLAVGILKFIFGERELDEDYCHSYTEKRPYHQQVRDATSPITLEPDNPRGDKPTHYTHSSLITRDMDIPGGTSRPPYFVSSLLRVVAAVLVASFIVVCSTTAAAVFNVMNWFHKT